MEQVQRYFFSILCSSLVCSIVKCISKESFYHKQISFLCGVFLTTTLTAPLFHLSLPAMENWNMPFQAEAEAICDEGMKLTQDSMARVIQEEAAAYIISRAQQMQCELTAEVQVSADQPPIPTSVFLTGNPGPQIKQDLERMIEAELGIPKELQIWIETQ